MTGATDGEAFRAARAEAEAFRAAQAARRAIEGRRPFRHGGGAATLLVVRNDDQIELLPHATDTWAITLDTAGTVELRDALTELLALGGAVMTHPATPYLRRLTTDHGWHGELIRDEHGNPLRRRDGHYADALAELLEPPEGQPQ